VTLDLATALGCAVMVCRLSDQQHVLCITSCRGAWSLLAGNALYLRLLPVLRISLPLPSSPSQLPTPPELAAEDPPLPFFLGDQRVLNPAIIIGSDLGRVLEGSSPELLVMLLATFRLSRFLVIPRGPAIHIILHVEVSWAWRRGSWQPCTWVSS
jgi:hypothetical protein